jgi:hypothetical protein
MDAFQLCGIDLDAHRADSGPALSLRSNRKPMRSLWLGAGAVALSQAVVPVLGWGRP